MQVLNQNTAYRFIRYSRRSSYTLSVEFDCELAIVATKRVAAPSLFRIGVSSRELWGPPDTDLASRQTGLLIDGTGWRTRYLPELPDRPYHPDAKVVLPKPAFGLTMLASL